MACATMMTTARAATKAASMTMNTPTTRAEACTCL
jgi:hypothetical protein